MYFIRNQTDPDQDGTVTEHIHRVFLPEKCYFLNIFFVLLNRNPTFQCNYLD